MKSKSFFIISVFFFFLSITSTLNAQTIGKLFTKSKADSLYGTVIFSTNIKTADLENLLSKTSHYIMFSLKNDSLEILNNNRKALLPAGITVPRSKVFHIFSVSIVRQLITKGKKMEIYIEHRKKVLTITNGEYTLEESELCPPICIGKPI